MSDVRTALTALADAAPLPGLDFESARRTARGRVRRRRLLACVPVALLALAVPLVLGSRGGDADTLEVAQAPASAPLRATVEATLTRPSGAADAALTVVAVRPTTTLGVEQAEPVVLAFSATSSGSVQPLAFGPYAEWDQVVEADDGAGVLGIGGHCAVGWAPDGSRGGPRCPEGPAADVLAAGEPAFRPLSLWGRVGGRSTVPGVYRLTHRLDNGLELRLRVTVNEVPALPSPRPGAPTTTVGLFFSPVTLGDCTEVRRVDRAVPATRAVAAAALEALFAGPTEQERAQGAGGFGPATAGLLRSVRVADGTAFVDLRADLFPSWATTSCGMGIFGATTGQTLRQFPTVQDVVYALDGSPRRFTEALQGACPDPEGLAARCAETLPG